MHSTGSETAAGDTGLRQQPPRGRSTRVVFLILCVVVILTGGGFLWFIHMMPEDELPPTRSADGIVVLTGAAFRINDAVELLAAGRGRRLLITGVNPTTHSGEISRLLPAHRQWFNCCVDLDHTATNTIGNAIETRRWVKARGFQSVIIVTSNFHMPRAMAEIGHQLPGVELVPYAVVSDKVRVESWWENPATARLLFLEYLKYIVARGRMWLPTSYA